MNNLSNDEIKLAISTYEKSGNTVWANALRELLAYREAQGNVVAWRNKTTGWCGTVVVQGANPADKGYEPLYTAPQLPALPDEMSFEMMRAVQMHSELGAYAANNFSGAYDLFREFWSVACRAAMIAAAPKPDSNNVTDNAARQFGSLSSGSKNG